jgi:hypothetical protein
MSPPDTALSRELEVERSDRKEADARMSDRIAKLEEVLSAMVHSVETTAMCLKFGALIGFVWLCKQVPSAYEWAHGAWRIMFG